MNGSLLTKYAAVCCLIAFSAFSNALHAQSAATQTESGNKSATAETCKVVVKRMGGNCAVTATATATATDGTAPEAHNVKIVRVGGDGEAHKNLIVTKTIKDGKTTVMLNGKEVEAAAGTELPDDVKQMLDNIEITIDGDVEGDVNVSSTDGVDNDAKDDAHAVPAAKKKVRVMTFTSKDGHVTVQDNSQTQGNVMSLNIPYLYGQAIDTSNNGFRFKCKISPEAMKQKVQDMKEAFAAMRMDTATNGQCKIVFSSTCHKFDTLVSSAMSGAVPHVMMLNGDVNTVITIPDMPLIDIPDMPSIEIPDIDMPDAPVSVQSFETDDLDELNTMLKNKELSISIPDINISEDGTHTNVQKQYRVIIINRGGKEDGEMQKEVEIEVADALPQGSTNSDTQPTDVVDGNAINAEYFNVYPNPTPGVLNISFALTQPGTVSVTVSDILGNSVFSEVVEQLNGQYYKQLNMDTFARGTYIVRVEQNGQAISRTVAVQ